MPPRQKPKRLETDTNNSPTRSNVMTYDRISELKTQIVILEVSMVPVTPTRVVQTTGVIKVGKKEIETISIQ
jgi:hypothetical protein